MSTASVRRDWDELAVMDPLWAILSDPARQFNGWSLHEFLETGSAEIAGIMDTSQELSYPKQCGCALDFGCGIGRLTRALKCHFEHCIGVDISPAMVNQARELNPNCTFVVLDHRELRAFSDQVFDLIYSNIVLQHQSSATVIRAYIGEFLRILKIGGLLVFQLPHRIPIRYRLQARRRAYAALRTFGLSPDYLYRKLHLNPIRMIAVPEKQVLQFVAESGGRLLRTVVDQNGGPHIESRTYFVTRNKG
jgi:SAM-dependent methyltransferase